MTAPAPRVLVVDDDQAFRFAMKKALTRIGYDVDEAAGGHEALRKLESAPPDAALLDLRMDDLDGLEVLRRATRAPTRFVVLTGHGTVDAAVSAMKLGAFSFLEKPVDADVLRPLLDQAISEARRARMPATEGFAPPLIGASEAMEEVRRFVAQVGPTDDTVLVLGETGTGKEVVARHLHVRSPRLASRFVALNAACVPRELFESELFGHKKGSFTGAVSDRVGLFREADGGTLFIDEVGELPLDSQAKLLRALEERRIRPVGEAREIPVNVRIVAATNRDLWAEVTAGRFREDLYFRLQVFPLRLPPLRERVSDIPELAVHLLERIGASARRLDAGAVSALTAHHWPGNVRELLNVLRRASLFAGADDVLGGELVRRMVAASIFAHPSMAWRAPTPPPVVPMAPAAPAVTAADDENLSLAELERQHIERTLTRMGGNVTRAALALGIDRRTLQRKLKAYGIAASDE